MALWTSKLTEASMVALVAGALAVGMAPGSSGRDRVAERRTGTSTFASLGRIRSLNVIADSGSPVTVDPFDQKIVAWCGGSSIVVSVDGRRTTVSTGAADGPLRAEGMYDPGDRLLMRCADVLPLSRSRVLAAFGGETGPATGIFSDYPVETRDRGRTWTPVPVPRESTYVGFGGFRASGRGVEAIFAHRIPASRGGFDAADPVVEVTHDAGARWTAAPLACPAGGPCVTFGPFLPGNCAMGISTQDVLYSTDGGRSWARSPILDPGKLACGDARLVATGPDTALLINALSSYPIQRTIDRGASWTSVGMPVPNRLENAGGVLEDFGPGGVTLLSDGSLLLTGGGAYSGGWQLLRSGARRWCEVGGQAGRRQLATQASAIAVIGSDLWWLTYGVTRDPGPTPLHVNELPASAVRCA